MKSLEAKPLPYTTLPGLSKKQLAEHYKLYEGYIKKYNELNETVKTVDRSATNATYSEIREQNLEKAFALNAIKLHEAYFANMADQPTDCAGKVKDLIEAQWGSVENWAEDFAALGIAARGWVVLGWDNVRGVLENYICDAHNQGGVWDAQAILVLDVYEHAYFLDYATDRKDYIADFMKSVNWPVVNERLA